jgi:nicotinamide-nucleotide amidase
MLSPDLTALAIRTLEACRAGKLMVATAESCTGGLIAAVLTDIAGSSDVVDRGFVTYSNEAKQQALGVPATTIEAHGAVSEPTARAMAEGALARSIAQVAVSCTGIAGPGGATPGKPVGLVHLACARSGKPTLHLKREYGTIGRSEVRAATVADALHLILRQAEA